MRFTYELFVKSPSERAFNYLFIRADLDSKHETVDDAKAAAANRRGDIYYWHEFPDVSMIGDAETEYQRRRHIAAYNRDGDVVAIIQSVGWVDVANMPSIWDIIVEGKNTVTGSLPTVS